VISKRRKMPQIAESDDDRSLRTITQACALLSCSRPTIYKLWREGRLELVKLGGWHTRVTFRSLNRLLNDIMKDPK
jgi:excisionase family DNA binding protein